MNLPPHGERRSPATTRSARARFPSFARALALAGVLGAALAAAPATPAAAYLRIAEAPGESVDAAHLGWIDITGFENSLVGAAPAVTRPGRAATGSVHLRKATDRATPILAGAVASDQVFERAEIELTRTLGSGRVVFYRVELGGVRVRSFVANSLSNDATTEGLQLGFDSASWVYTEFSSATGRKLASHQAKWDFVRQTGGSSSSLVGFTVRSVTQPGGKLGIQWTPEPGRRYTLRQSLTPEGPYAVVRRIEPATTPESRWEELPPGLPFAFFLLEEE